MTRERAGFLAVLLGSALTLACGPTFPDPAAVRAVILVDVDTLRADHLSAYGYARQTSPNIDAFARRAVQFDWAFSQAPNTLPSQTSILTSLYPSTHLVLHDGDRLAPAVVTLAERFQEAGFATGAFIDGGYMKSQFGLDQGFDTYFDINGGGLAVGESHIGKWLAEQSQGRFFLLIHTYDVHTPYAPREPFRSRFLADLAAPTPGFEPTSEALESIRMSQYTAEPRSLASRDLEYARALYDGEVALVDDWFGRFLRQLDDLGLTDSTVVALVSDHGEEFQEHGSVLHEKLYRTVTHVPLVVFAPGARNGRRVGQTVETIDLAPTLLELAGVAAAAADEGMQGTQKMEGRSLVPWLAGEPPAQERMAFSESPFFGVQRAATSDLFRLILTLESGKIELFRSREDPAEAQDLAAVSPDLARPLLHRLRLWSAGRPPERMLQREAVALPEEVEKSLRALGYLQ